MSVYGSDVTPYVSADLDNENLEIVGGNPSIDTGMRNYWSLVNEAASRRPAQAGIAASSVLNGSNVLVSMSVKAAQTGEYKVAAWLLEDDIYGSRQENTRWPHGCSRMISTDRNLTAALPGI